MVHDIAKLAPNLFDKPDMAATRDGFGKALLELGEKDPRVVVLCADLAESTRVLAFKEKYPDRYIEIGVAEQNLATVASGLANYGKIPFIASYAAFSPGRNNEQIRTTISLNNVPVKIAGMHAGISVGPDGGTHQALEDMALMRVQPNMTVLSPIDSIQAYHATLAAVAHQGPVYLRFAREKTPIITTSETSFEFGKAQVLWESDHAPEVVIFTTGPLSYQALLAAKTLEHAIPMVVINLHTVKPLDQEAVVQFEEHQVAGGLGGAVAEVLAEKCPTPMEFVGVKDAFGQSGESAELLQYYQMDAEHIAEAVRAVQYRKQQR
jgi:transketolase